MFCMQTICDDGGQRVQMTHSFPARPTVVVLGGGYAGIQVARPLDDLADVVLVEPKDDFVHNVAALRALVDPAWLERIYLPYTGLLGRGRVIKDRAVKADADRVVLASGAELFPDYLVLATGSGYPFPAKPDLADPDLTSTEAAHAKVRNTHAALAGAGRVLLLGAGPVGIELAGEIKAVWPGKQVTLVDVAGDVLGERYRPDLKAELRRQLTDLGAGLLLGSPLRAGPPTAPGEPGTFTVTTQAGDEVTADIWFRCYGVVPASDYLAGVARPEYLTDRESVRADGIFQDLVLVGHRARPPIQIEHRGRLGVPGRDHRVTVETAAARIGDVPAQHGVIRDRRCSSRWCRSPPGGRPDRAGRRRRRWTPRGGRGRARCAPPRAASRGCRRCAAPGASRARRSPGGAGAARRRR